MEAEVMEERQGSAAVEVGAKKSGPSGVGRLGTELFCELGGLLLDPPGGWSEDEASRLG
jgi:hypothetical protein